MESGRSRDASADREVTWSSAGIFALHGSTRDESDTQGRCAMDLHPLRKRTHRPSRRTPAGGGFVRRPVDEHGTVNGDRVSRGRSRLGSGHRVVRRVGPGDLEVVVLRVAQIGVRRGSSRYQSGKG
jgi:hypothetical protein